MDKEWWFFVDGFMSWLRGEFPAALSEHFAYDTIVNIINYVLKTTETKSEFLEAMIEIIPEVTMDEWLEWINK